LSDCDANGGRSRRDVSDSISCGAGSFSITASDAWHDFLYYSERTPAKAQRRVDRSVSFMPGTSGNRVPSRG
jgi:hypothetical protein